MRKESYLAAAMSLSFQANAQIFKTDLIKNNCITALGFIENCDFYSLQNEKLVNNNSYTLPMDFFIDYSRGKCCTVKRNNSCSDPGELNLQLFTGHDYRNFEYGKNNITISGKFLKLIDLKSWETSTERYYQPCHLVIKEAQIDFSKNSKIYLKELIQNRNLAKKYIDYRNNLEFLISELNLSFAELNVINFQENLESFINNFYLISEIDIPQPDKVLLLYFINNFKNSNNSIKMDLFNKYNRKMLDIIENTGKIFDHYYKNEYQIEFYKMDIEIFNIINEAKSDNNFKQESLEELKNLIEE